MRYFDYSFLKNEIPSNITQLLIQINKMQVRDEYNFFMYNDVYTQLESIAKIQSIKASNAIEGIITSDKRLDEMINHKSTPLNHAEQEILGYSKLLELIHNQYYSLSLKTKDLLYYHRILYTYFDFYGKGQLKQEDNAIISIQNRYRKIVFEPISAHETEFALEQLYLAYLDASNDMSINKLLLISCYILDFLCIHPFSDGNGRISRILTLLLLYKNDYEIGKYISIENSIINHKEQYYQTLEKSSKNWHTNENDYWAFTEFFLLTLVDCYSKMEDRFSIVQKRKMSKKERIYQTLESSIVPLSKSDIHDYWPDIAISTISEELNHLVKSGKIKKIGSYKNAKYFRVE